jgi:ribosomal protein S18 acetylase RimI-like enzyme
MSETGPLTPIPWETRNLGVPSFTLSEPFFGSFDEKALSLEIENQARRQGRLFVQARLNKDRIQHAAALQRAGFFYAEANLSPFADLAKNRSLREFEKDPAAFIPGMYVAGEVRVARVEKADQGPLAGIRSIARESFLDDRFHLDPNCPRSLADERFVHWVNDLAADDSSVFYVLSYQGDPMGFMVRKGEEMILTGFGKEYRSSGLGDFLWLSTMSDMSRNGLTKAHTLISTNNMAVLNLYSRLGFSFKDASVTFHCWKGPADGAVKP